MDRRTSRYLFAVRDSAVSKSWSLSMKPMAANAAAYRYSIVLDAAGRPMVHEIFRILAPAASRKYRGNDRGFYSRPARGLKGKKEGRAASLALSWPCGRSSSGYGRPLRRSPLISPGQTPPGGGRERASSTFCGGWPACESRCDSARRPEAALAGGNGGGNGPAQMNSGGLEVRLPKACDR